MLDEMRMRTACFAHAPQRWTSRLSKHFLLIFQEVAPLSKTRNQLRVMRIGKITLLHILQEVRTIYKTRNQLIRK